ncbi:MAG: response regulator [Verrucomicrobiota bacterium]
MRPKILTVDDSKTIRLIIARAFKPFDCEVLEASNGTEGLFAAGKHRPDLIILDYTMPIMDGPEMLSRLKCDPQLGHIPVVMLTAEAGRENVVRLARMGVQDYLIKPFKEDLLIDRVGRIINLKAKGEVVAKIKRFDDPLTILLVDDKPKILEQIQFGLAETNWKVHGCSQTGEALAFCNEKPPQVILVSLLLPENEGFDLFQLLRSSVHAKDVPVFGLCVKTATAEQERAQQMGFANMVTKPIDFDDLKSKISRALDLDTSYKYFEQRDGIVHLRCPAEITPLVVREIIKCLSKTITEAVDAGLDKLVLDFSSVNAPDVDLIKLAMSAIQLCRELSVKYQIIGSAALRQESKKYEESSGWLFSDSWEEASRLLNSQVPVNT